MKKIIVLKVAKVPVISETKQNTTSQIFHESKEKTSSSKKASLKERRTNNLSKSFFLMLNHKSLMKEVLVWLAYNWGVLLKPYVKRRCLDFIILFSQTIVRFDVTILSFDFVLQNHLQLFSKILPIIITFTASAITYKNCCSSFAVIILNFYAAVAAALWFWFDSIRN